MDLLSASEAADRLGVSPRRVRQLIQDGLLRAARVGNSWAVDPASVEQRRRRDAPTGRPYGAANVWKMARMADLIMSEADPAGAGRLQRSQSWDARSRWFSLYRLRNLLAHDDPDSVLAMLRNRAARVEFLFAHPSVRERLARDPRIVRSGARAAADAGVDIVPDQHIDAYVRERDIERIERKYGLQRSSRSDANVWLRVIDELLIEEGIQDAPLLLVCADLRERDDARSKYASDRSLGRLRHALAGAERS